VSGGTRNNMAYLAPWTSFASGVPEDVAGLQEDAQPSGEPLLATSSPYALLAKLGVPSAVIGRVKAGSPGRIDALNYPSARINDLPMLGVPRTLGHLLVMRLPRLSFCCEIIFGLKHFVLGCT
jgi:hypothetical protein